jgi:hypothetical protein
LKPEGVRASEKEEAIPGDDVSIAPLADGTAAGEKKAFESGMSKFFFDPWILRPYYEGSPTERKEDRWPSFDADSPDQLLLRSSSFFKEVPPPPRAVRKGKDINQMFQYFSEATPSSMEQFNIVLRPNSLEIVDGRTDCVFIRLESGPADWKVELSGLKRTK